MYRKLLVRTLLLLLPPVLLPAGASCARRPAGGGTSGARRAVWTAPAPVVVVNRHWADVRILAVHDGVTSRVGIVPAASSATLRLRPAQIGTGGQLRLIADPVGGPSRLLSEVISLRPGERIEWTLEQRLRSAALAIY